MALLQNSRINKSKLGSTTVYTVISISLVLFFVGLLGVLMFFANKVSVIAKENVVLSVVIKDKTKLKEIKKLQSKLQNKEYVKNIEYVSKEKAAKFLEKELGEDFVGFLGFNPLQASLEIKLKSKYVSVSEIEKIKQKILNERVVSEINYQKPLLENIDKNIAKIGTIILLLTALMYIVSLALIHSTIRLTIHSRRIIIRTMRLIGATNEFIKKPFIINGILQGLISSLIAVMMIGAVLIFIDNEFGDIISLNDIPMISIVFVGIVVVGVILSYFSVSFATNKFLNARGDDAFYK